jgi:uncharacterized protein (TIGR02246 family)
MPVSQNPASEPQAEAEIRSIVEGWANAVRTRDSKALASHLDPDVLLFDLVNPLRSTGSAAVADRAEQWLSSFEGPIGYELLDLSITASGNAAFCHSLNHVHGTTEDGNKIDMWWRATVCFTRQEGKWLVIHEHSSVPLDINTGKASLDLKP